MFSKEFLVENLNNTLNETNFKIGKLYRGKVRDNYVLKDKRIIIATDRLSAFDKVLTKVPFKGQMLTQMSNHWFKKTRHIVKNHIIDTPDPNVVVVHECKPLPIEMVVRGYLTGSLWRSYEKGERTLYGLRFNANLRKNQKFDFPIFTPTTKAEYGAHDEPISKEEIIKQGIIDEKLYEQMEEVSQALFDFGSEELKKTGLILVDTKYEFGLLNNELVLIDEIHTSDSSRFWYLDEYDERFEKGEDQRALDKEYFRQWLISQGYMGEGELPKIPDEVLITAALKYHEALKRITGADLATSSDSILDRITKNLKEKGYLKED